MPSAIPIAQCWKKTHKSLISETFTYKMVDFFFVVLCKHCASDKMVEENQSPIGYNKRIPRLLLLLLVNDRQLVESSSSASSAAVTKS